MGPHTVFTAPYPDPRAICQTHNLSIRVFDKVRNNWGHDSASLQGEGQSCIYNANIPLVHELLGGLEWALI